MNPIMSMLRSQKTQQPETNQNDQSQGNLRERFIAFQKQMQGKDAKTMVDELRASGKMTEQQYQNLLTRARSLEPLLRR